MKRILGAVLSAGLMVAATGAAAQQGSVEYRDESEGVNKPVVDIEPVVPLDFVPADKHFKVISNRAGQDSRERYDAARFQVDNENFEVLAGSNFLVVSTKPWHPARDGISATRDFVPRLMRCHDLPGNLGCTIHANREDVATLYSRYVGGRDVWTIGFDPSEYVLSKGIELGHDTQLTIGDGSFEFTRDYALQPGFLIPTRPVVRMSNSDGDRVLKALSEGRDVTVSFPDKDGTKHDYVISSRDARVGFLVFQHIWPRLLAAHQAKQPAP